jgi:hypothetical protein
MLHCHPEKPRTAAVYPVSRTPRHPDGLSSVQRWGRLRIPEKATTLSGAWRPRDPVDDDQGGARA